MHLEMKVDARGITGFTAVAQEVSLADLLPGHHCQLRKVGIKRRVSISVVDDHIQAIRATRVPARESNCPPRGRAYPRGAVVEQVDIDPERVVRSKVTRYRTCRRP